MKAKLYALDYFRILLTASVLLFHAKYVAGVDFGVFNPVFYAASVYMAGFFMLSGFLSFYIHKDTEFDSREAREYIKKKVLSFIT